MKKIISIIFSCFICHVGYSENNLEYIIQLNEALYNALHEKDQRISGFFFPGKKEDTFHFTPVEKKLIVNALKKQVAMYMKKGKTDSFRTELTQAPSAVLYIGECQLYWYGQPGNKEGADMLIYQGILFKVNRIDKILSDKKNSKK
ncbi:MULTISPECIES: hypothetical protein [unclassified Akkermansia]|jgi:hypothetical protein|uniref:hypothetical protein n=1 Tax=Bacteria TaxID=2 RepID=UPI00079802AF|nr:MULTISPECIES: hypothetical protein [unclassified Akkermansia]KXT49783.1 hypothetical protein HMPREF3038_01863 [Akkermansia sp. KLE1797]KXU54759.1 hypothetical protein HMPREF3039_01059 [Akkermansia sp. KLE1798]KZA05013.1 hypothetical protein HMPREF1326_01300 [Akkermansia sp. KLE1605]